MYEQRHIKVFFKNGLTCEGKVMTWCSKEGQTDAVLQSIAGGDFLHLYDVKENVQMVRVFEENSELGPTQTATKQPQLPSEEVPTTQPIVTKQVPRKVPARAPKPVNELPKKPPVVEPPVPELKQRVTDQTMRLKKLAELREMQQRGLKKQISDHLTSADMTDINKPTYEYPDFTKRNA